MSEIEITGLDETIQRLDAATDKIRDRVRAAMRAEAEDLLAEAKTRVPVDTGALRESGHVVQGEGFETAIVFGGPSAPYAVQVHEDLLAKHPSGQAKFLETPALESTRSLGEKIANRV